LFQGGGIPARAGAPGRIMKVSKGGPGPPQTDNRETMA